MSQKLKVLILFFLIFLGCSPKEESSDGIERKDIILLTESQISNFIKVLPALLEYSELYHSRLSEEEKNRVDANKRYFRSILKNPDMKMVAISNNFASIEEMVRVYKNVALEYSTIKTDLTNFNKDVENLKNTIDSYRSNYIAGLKDENLSGVDKKTLEDKLKELEKDEIRYKNILLIKKYESVIDKVYVEYYR